MSPVKKSEEEKYGWWEPAPGSYRVVFNESLDELNAAVACLQIWPDVEQANVAHPARVYRRGQSELSALIHVAAPGTRRT